MTGTAEEVEIKIRYLPYSRTNNHYALRDIFMKHGKKIAGRTKVHIVESIDRHGAFWPVHLGLRR
jgi:hypothetical protein